MTEKSKKTQHIVFTVFREISVDRDKQIASFNKELAVFLDSNYMVLGSGITSAGFAGIDRIFAIVTKEMETK